MVDEKTYEYEIVRHDKNDMVMGRIWWDGKAIQVSKSAVKIYLKTAVIGGKSWDDGLDFLKKLPALLKSGYVSARRIS